VTITVCGFFLFQPGEIGGLGRSCRKIPDSPTILEVEPALGAAVDSPVNDGPSRFLLARWLIAQVSPLAKIICMTAHGSVVVFDLGGVLIDWNPRYLYRKLFPHEGEMEDFLANICTAQWNLQQDAGRSFAEACAALKLDHPHKAEMIDAWFERFDEMMAGPIAGTVDILAELREREVPICALSNWSAETFPFAQRRFEFLQWFRAIFLSAEVRMVKPDPRIFRNFCEKFALRPEEIIYVDDLQHNVEAARAIGMHAIQFRDPASLRLDLVRLGVLAARARIEHVAAWVLDLDRARCFYERWFHADSTPEYSSTTRDFRSRFLSLDGGSRLELMVSPQKTPRHAHIAISVGSRSAVDRLVKEMEQTGVQIVSRPRVTGDGYYEALIADTEGNLVEITA
jgi:2-haloacid dehalogenase